MRTATASEIKERIDAEATKDPGGAIVFDGDGTLWSGDIGDDYFLSLLAADRFTPIAHEAIVAEAEAENVDVTGTTAAIAKRIHEAYLAGTFPEERVCELMVWACAGWSKSDLDAFAAKVLPSFELAKRLHREAVGIAEWATSRSIEVHLVSASPRAIVEQAARLVGIGLARVSAATEALDASSVVRTAVLRPIPYGPGKVARLRQKLGPRPLYAAFGDNAFDVAMLREARVPVAIRPKPRLVERAAEVPGLVTLEPA